MKAAVTPAFWEGKKVYLTGHTGFKGSWLSLWLQSMGAEVMGYALAPPTTPARAPVLLWGTWTTIRTWPARSWEGSRCWAP